MSAEGSSVKGSPGQHKFQPSGPKVSREGAKLFSRPGSIYYGGLIHDTTPER